MKTRSRTVFQPSKYSGGCGCGCGGGCSPGYGCCGEYGTTEETAPASSGYSEYIPMATSLVSGAVKSFMGEEDARTSAAELEAKLKTAQKSLARGDGAPFLKGMYEGTLDGREYWSQQVTKLKAQLGAAREAAALQEESERIAQARDVAFTVASFVGVIVLGSVGLVFVQKARIQQAELRKLQTGV